MGSVKLLLGSNLGDRRELIDSALREIELRVGKIVRGSSMRESAPWGYESTNYYVNMVVEVRTEFSPEEVLDLTQKIEWDLGRRRRADAEGYEDRPIDIDLLYYHRDGDVSFEGERVKTERLELPHPRIMEREFVLVLLRELGVPVGK